MGTIPPLRIIRSSYVDTAAHTHLFGYRQGLHVGRYIGSTLVGIGVQHIIPDSDFSQHDIMPDKCFSNCLDTLGLVQGYRWTNRGSIPGLNISTGDSVWICQFRIQAHTKSHENNQKFIFGEI
jgi:hypothetical protein